jgi:hypothetical protein
MTNKYTFTYEYVSNSGPKTATVVVVEDVESIEDILNSFKNFLSGSGFSFAPGCYLEVVSGAEQSNTENSDNT